VNESRGQVNTKHWNKQLVLVENIQFVQGPQGNIPSLVGFYNIQEKINDKSRAGVIGETLLFQSALDATYKFFPMVTDWKPCTVIGGSCVGIEDLIVENIKRTLEVVEHVSNDESTARSIQSRCINLEKKTVASPVFLDANGVKVRFSKGLQQCIKVIDVLHGPFNLTS